MSDIYVHRGVGEKHFEKYPETLELLKKERKAIQKKCKEVYNEG